MKKLLMLMTVLLLSLTVLFAQNRTISGKIVSEKGDPVPFATVKIKGTKKGVSADANGLFTIAVNKAGEIILSFSSQGFEEKEVSVGNDAFLEVSLKSTGELQEVVVTGAFNIKRAQRNVSYASQNINAEQLNTIRQQNVVSSLAGKIAGIQLRDQSYAKLNSQSSIRLRGESSFSGSTVLYVVDGTPQNSIDINPDDVEDITVLKGVNATAILGDRAASGAIVITTKKGRARKGIGVEVNSGVRFDKIYILPKYQNDYAGGANYDFNLFTWQPGMPDEWKALDGKYYPDYTDDASWGPRIAGQEYIPWYAWYPGTKYSFKTASLTPQPNNIRQFFETGTTFNNNINFSKSGSDYYIRVSYTNIKVKGLIPTSDQVKHTLNTALSFDLNSHFTLSSNISYVTENLNGDFNDNYANQGTGSFNSWFHRDLDLKIIKEFRGYRAPGGFLPSWNHLNPGAYLGDNDGPASFYSGNYWFNFYDFYDQNKRFNRRERLVGDVTFKYKVNNQLSFSGTIRKNQVFNYFENQVGTLLDPKPSGAALNSLNVPAGYATGQNWQKEDNFELLSSYNNKFGEFAVNANAGAAVRKELFRSANISTSGGLAVPELYAVTNSKDPITYSNGRTKSEIRSVFGRADIGYKNFVFIEGTLRNDWFSTLRPEANSILYKSFGGSFIFSEFTQGIFPWLNYGKLRASWGQIPTSLTPYRTNFAYSVDPNQWNGNILQTTPNELIDSAIEGATHSLFEIGTELRFLKSRLTVDVTYYNRTYRREPVSLTLPATSGFSSLLVNIGKTISKGLEVQLSGKVFQQRNFSWTSVVNYSYSIANDIKELYPGITRYIPGVPGFTGAFSASSSAFTAHFAGERWGQLTGYGIQKNAEGVPIVDPVTGLYQRTTDQIHYGSVLPNYTGGFLNTFTYKDFVLNVNIDFQQGGKYFSLSDFWGTFSGLTAVTASLNDKGNPVRDNVSNGGGVAVNGVSKTDGKPITVYVDAQTYFHQFRNNNISERSVYDLTYIKMREVSLGYKLPVKKWGLSKIVQNATFSVVARNPWLVYAQNRDFDPSEVTNIYGEDGQFPGTRSLGFNLKIGF